MPTQDWRALGMGRPMRDPAEDPVAGFLARALGLDQPSLGSRMQDLDRMQRERFAAGGGPAPPGSEEANLGLDIASNFNFLGTFAGPKAKTADLAKLDRAQKMAEIGYPAPTVWEETGWFKGPGGQWRFEIDDSQAAVNPSREALLARGMGAKAKRSDVFSHPEMEAAYPNQPEVLYDKRMGNNTYGSYTRGDPGLISINRDISGTNVVPEGKISERSAQLHEGQHFVQQRENFPRGGSPEEFAAGQLPYMDILREFEQLAKLRKEIVLDGREFNPNTVWAEARKVGYPAEKMHELAKQVPDTDSLMQKLAEVRQLVEDFDPFKRYERLAGETESRAVQRRMDLTPEQRAKRFPLYDYAAVTDRPLSELIIKR